MLLLLLLLVVVCCFCCCKCLLVICFRYKIWRKNVADVSRHNSEADKGRHSYWMGINKFTDMVSWVYIQA